LATGGDYYPGGNYNRNFNDKIEQSGGYDRVTPQVVNQIRDQLMGEFFGP
jgi:hypothetical protein